MWLTLVVTVYKLIKEMPYLLISLGLFLFTMLLILIFTFEKVHQRMYLWQILGIPHDKPRYIFGNLNGLSLARPLATAIRRTYNKYKLHRIPFCGFVMLTKPVAIVTDLELAQDILVRDADKFSDRGSYHNKADDTFSENLWSLEGEEWRELHRKLAPLFTPEKIQKLFPNIIQEADELVDALDEIEEEVVDIYDLSQRYIADVIADSLLALECHTLQKPISEFRFGNDHVTKPRSKVAVALMECQRITARAHHLTQTLEEVIDFFYSYIGAAILEQEYNKYERDNFIRQLVDIKNEKEEKNRLSFDEIVANSALFFTAGYDTCASTMTFALYELATKRHIQRKLKAEIMGVLEKHNHKITLEAIGEMKYLDMVISETLRKYPIYPYLERVANCNYPTKEPEFKILKGMTVFIPIEAILRDHDIYPDSFKFQPERFEAEMVKRHHPMAWIPFGAGPRSCIGMWLGQMMIRIGLITLLTNYEFLACSRTSVPMRIDKKSRLLRPEKEVYLRKKCTRNFELVKKCVLAQADPTE